MKQLLKIFIVIIVGLLLSIESIRGLDHEFPFIDNALNVVMAVIAIVTFIVIFFFDIRQFRKTKKTSSFIATFLGLLIFCTYKITFHSLQQRDNSPSKIYCVTKITDFNGVSIDFRDDGTYKLTSWSLGAYIYRGSYSIKDSIITIDKNKIENCIVSDKFLIRQDGMVDSLGKREKSIYQITSNGKIIENATDFRIIDDWKSK